MKVMWKIALDELTQTLEQQSNIALRPLAHTIISFVFFRRLIVGSEEDIEVLNNFWYPINLPGLEIRLNNADLLQQLMENISIGFICHLNLSYFNVFDDGIDVLAHHMKNSKLSVLKLKHTGVSDVGANLVTQIMIENENVSDALHLDVRENQLITNDYKIFVKENKKLIEVLC